MLTWQAKPTRYNDDRRGYAHWNFTNCHLILGQNVVTNVCSSLTPVGNVLGFAEKEEYHDIAKMLNGCHDKS